MKRFASSVQFIFVTLSLAGLFSCSNDNKPVNGNVVDSVHDTITGIDVNDSTKIRFKKLVSAMPVPFDMLKKFSGAHLPFKGELLNNPENAPLYNTAGIQSLNLGIYGADLAYMISQDKMGDGAPFLKSIRRLSDQVVVPSAFDASTLKRFDTNQDQKDSLQNLMHASYKRIDSTLQGNDRLALATLVLTGGWMESIYLTTQHIGEEKQNEKNKVLFDMLAVQQPYLENITELLGSFPNDSLCKNLHADFVDMKKTFPSGPNIAPDKFSEQLNALREQIAAIRARIIKIK
jgi:hypothetical protein